MGIAGICIIYFFNVVHPFPISAVLNVSVMWMRSQKDSVIDYIITAGQTSPHTVAYQYLSLYPTLPGLSLATAEPQCHDA